MTIFRNISFVLFISLIFSGYVISLTCYSCAHCDDPFDANASEEITNNASGLYCKKTKGSYIVDRNITDVCTPFTAVGDGVWCCQTDLCNDGNRVLPMIHSLGLVVIVGVISKFI